MPRNPYTLVFGKTPAQNIQRLLQREEIIQNFLDEDPSQQVYMITGVRGAGKTVFMTEVAGFFRNEKNWIVTELNPERDLLGGLVAKLGADRGFARLFQNASLNLSFFGVGLEVKNEPPITDIEMAAGRMLSVLKKHGKRILILIDEVSNTKTMREFVGSYQIFIRQNLPVYLLMTGLYENINDLQNEPNLTFLYRAPKIILEPLSLGAVKDNYKVNFGLDDDSAFEMARLTKGYPFAFQLLGYLAWQAEGNYRSILQEYRQILEDSVYAKIWSELSDADRLTAYGIASSPDGSIRSIRSITGLSSNMLNQYRRRLIQKGLVDGSLYGHLIFTLPLFDDFVRESGSLK